MAGKIDDITALNPSRDDWGIVARVIRLWAFSAGDRTNTTTSIELILVDEKDFASQYGASGSSALHVLSAASDIVQGAPLLPGTCAEIPIEQSSMANAVVDKIKSSPTESIGGVCVGKVKGSYEALEADVYVDLSNDGDAVKLLTRHAENSIVKKAGGDCGSDKNKTTPTKRIATDGTEGPKGSYSPMLLKTIKLEKL